MSACAATVHTHVATYMDTQVRERVHSLLRLAEMKWRYRVVEKGQSPRDEGLKLLYMAKQVKCESVISEEYSSSACWSYTLGTYSSRYPFTCLHTRMLTDLLTHWQPSSCSTRTAPSKHAHAASS